MVSPNKINFTKKTLESLPIPEEGKRLYFRDTKVLGLELMVTDKGSKSFKVFRKLGDKPVRVTIGKFPDYTVDQARDKATEINNLINKGINPNVEKRKLSQEITLNDLFTKFLNEHSKLHKKSWQEDERTFKNYLKPLSAKKISKIEKDSVKSLHIKIKNDNGLYVANRALALLNTMFNHAINWGWDGNNPCTGIKKFKEKSRDRFLQPDEIKRFFQALEEEPNQTAKDYVYLSILTGARKSNVLSMSWDEISFDRCEWKIPETKNGDSITIPLTEESIRILKSRKELNKIEFAGSEFVFPGTGKSGHLADPKKPWKRILKKAKITDFRIHDLRRTMGSYQAIMGANSYTIGKSLGHKSQAATAIYARMNLDPVRKSMELATKEIIKHRDGE